MPKSDPTRKTRLAWITLAFGLLASIFSGIQVKQGIEADAVNRFAYSCDQVALKVQERLQAYALILRGGAGLFAASAAVDRGAWRGYVETLKTNGSIPGVEGIGFAQVIPPDQLAAHVAGIRAEGFPDYSVRPPGERARYTAIIYLEPFRGRNLRAFGYDMYSESVRRAAMAQARDTGEAALSGKVELVQEADAEVQAGTLMFVPVYRQGAAPAGPEQRRAALRGWVFSPYRMNDLMIGMIGDWKDQDGKAIDMHVYDGWEASPAGLLYDSNPDFQLDRHSLFYQQRGLDFNGRHWLLAFDRPPQVHGVDYWPAGATLAGGLALNGLLFWLMRAVFNTRADAQRIAAELTAEITQGQQLLRQAYDQVHLLLDSAAEGIYAIDLDGNCVFCNSACLQLLGYQRPEDLLGRNMHSLIHAHHADGTPVPMAESRILQTLQKGQTVHVDDEVLWRRDGTAFTAEYWSAPEVLDGVTVGTVVSFLDLTERKRQERQIVHSRNIFATIIDTVPMRVFWKGLDLCYLGCNMGFAQDAGMAHPRDIIGKDDYQMGWVAQADRYRTEDLAILESGIAKLSYDEPHTTPDGRTRWLRTSKVPLKTREDEVFGLLGVYEDITSRKETELALAISEERLRVITSSAQDGIIMLDAVGQIAFWNEAAEQIFGYTGAEVLGRHMRVLLAPPSLPEGDDTAFAQFPPIGQSAQVGRTFELTGRRKDGSEFPLALSISTAHVTGAWHSIGILRDITEMKQMQDALARRESEMRTTLYAIGEGVISLDSKGRVLLMNPVAEQWTGWREAQARGKSFAEVFCVVDEETRARVEIPVAEAFHHVSIVAIAANALLIARDGSECAIGGSAAPILGQALDVTGVVLVFRDLTEEREAAGVVRDQLAIIETYDGLVALADRDGRLIYVNAGGTRMLGAAAPAELLGKDLTDFISRTTPPAAADDSLSTAIAHGAFNGETMLKRLDGTGPPVSQTLFAIPDAYGHPRHIGAIIMDISLQKKMQEQLLMSEKLAVMGRLLADVSHELNNPLAIVIGRTELILKRLDEQSALKAKLETVLKNARRCKTILGNLLAYSGTIGKKEGVIDLPALLREALEAVTYQYDMSAIAVTLDCELAADLEVPGTKDALLSVFVNLVRNARQAMPKQGRLVITVAPDDAGLLRIAVRDTGVGMSKERLQTMFQPFNSGWTDGGGTGIGLATSRGIIETHGGRMWVESDGEGHGTQFTILLPYRRRRG